ncbi:hypothetical protein [Flagellimonas allohymeniacidonis]|uniref:SMP-30/Gluconolactonase/LRE-like region domain-containing protein n=1 Tax=Flagellimonas allohymeniacidonis TaxID=2517819 RepID=A0A4Q8QID3_9FLAO|nr:hypothetical protein [Allomuricauda hymeniacidonis]TAI49008.1 hypothetical protein EW142_04220 [Allomuricauda hymeniacidonis]
MKTTNYVLSKSSTIHCLLIALAVSVSSCFRGEVPNQENAEVETLISNFPANDALSVGRNGSVYASNFGQFGASGGTGTTILKVNPRKMDFVPIAENLTGPLGNAVDKSGNVYVNNANNFVSADILKIAKNGTQTVLATIEGFPSGMTLDTKNNLYISNFSTPTVHKVTPEGEVTLIANDVRLAGGVGIDFDGRGNLLVGNYATGQILSVSLDGQVELIASIPVVIENFVLGYITYHKGFIYGTAIGENLIYKVSLKGEVEVFAGTGVASTTDGLLLEATFNAPNGIAADPIRNILYISEFGGSGSLRAIKLF